MAAAQNSSGLPWLWQRWQSWRPIAAFTENERRRSLGLDSCNGQLPYHCTPDRFEGSNPSKFGTCPIVISARTLSKSTPGTVVPHSVTRRLGAHGPFRSLYISLWGTGTAPSIDQFRRCQPAGGRQSRPALSSDSSTSPKRSFLTHERIARLRSRERHALVHKVEHLLLRIASRSVLELRDTGRSSERSGWRW